MLRSEHILKGLGNQYYRATYKSMGFTTEDLKRPLIGIANAWTASTAQAARPSSSASSAAATAWVRVTTACTSSCPRAS